MPAKRSIDKERRIPRRAAALLSRLSRDYGYRERGTLGDRVANGFSVFLEKPLHLKP